MLVDDDYDDNSRDDYNKNDDYDNNDDKEDKTKETSVCILSLHFIAGRCVLPGDSI
jgi:hypothetical protein